MEEPGPMNEAQAEKISDKQHLLITGMPGSGKTTLLVRLATSLPASGFYTEEIRRGGVREGFRLVGLDGSEAILSHVSFRGGPRVGRYGVDVPAFDDFLRCLDLRSASSPLLFIDEIGKMESLSPLFVETVKGLLDSSATVVATVAAKGEGIIREVKLRRDCEIVQVTPTNRESLAGSLSVWIRGRLGAGDGPADAG
jgi:nucleoside-triphosphatase